jgi:RNase H-fold protein (predicted Holliday junction resolvase)
VIGTIMSDRIAPADPARVLAVVPTPRYTGFAVVDGWGLAPNGFATWSLQDTKTDQGRTRSLTNRLLRSIRQHQPAVLVLGIPRFDDAKPRLLREVAANLAAACDVPVVVHSVADARRLLLGRTRGQVQRALADRLTRGFFPELAAVKSNATSERYRCHAFEAVALALHELVHRAPLSAAVVAKTEAFGMGNFNAALSASCRRHDPVNP